MARSEFNKLMEKGEGNCSAGFIDTYMPVCSAAADLSSLSCPSATPLA